MLHYNSNSSWNPFESGFDMVVFPSLISRERYLGIISDFCFDFERRIMLLIFKSKPNYIFLFILASSSLPFGTWWLHVLLWIFKVNLMEV